MPHKPKKKPKNSVMKRFALGTLKDSQGRVVRSRKIAQRIAKKNG